MARESPPQHSRTCQRRGKHERRPSAKPSQSLIMSTMRPRTPQAATCAASLVICLPDLQGVPRVLPSFIGRK